MKKPLRFRSAVKAAIVHLMGSAGVALATAFLVLGVWYPYPYRELSGGRELFLLVIGVDIVCGPLLTLVLFSPAKPRAELWRDLSLVMLIQLAALGYGVHTAWHVRPVFLVMESDRFKVEVASTLESSAIEALPVALQPRWSSGPITVAIREPKDAQERKTVLFESVQGGKDYAERPEFYLPYEGLAALKSLQRAKPLSVFLRKQPDQQAAARKLAKEKKADVSQWLYLPVVARQDWVAVLDQQGRIQGFLKGDGF